MVMAGKAAVSHIKITNNKPVTLGSVEHSNVALAVAIF
jgi:hypothetical protein